MRRCVICGLKQIIAEDKTTPRQTEHQSFIWFKKCITYEFDYYVSAHVKWIAPRLAFISDHMDLNEIIFYIDC